MSKATLADIAARAGVGTATVERVLNGRGGVSPTTARKVIAAARDLDYPKRLPELYRGLLRIEVMLVRPDSTFFRRLARSLERIAATLDPYIQIHRSFVDETNPHAIAGHIRANALRRTGLILAVPNHPAIRDAVSACLSAGVPVIHIVTRADDIAGELVSIDNYAAGRTAAMLMSRMQQKSGTVIALCNPIFQVHHARMRGFSDYFAEHPRVGLDFAWTGFARDDADRACDLLHEALAAFPDLVGIYNTGAANGALSAFLRRRKRAGDIFFVGHELTDRSAEALRDGVMSVVLDQAPEAQARRAIDLLLKEIGLLDVEVDRSPIRFVTVTAENL